MPDPADLTSPPAAETAAPQTTAPAPQPAPAELLSQWRSFLDEDDDTDTRDSPAVVSNGTAEPASTTADVEAQDAESAREGVSASEAPAPEEEPGAPADTPPSRREQERLAHEKAIADLQAKVARYESPEGRQQLRDEILAEQAQQATTDQEIAQARADAERYARLLATPTNDLSNEDFNWREEQTELRAKYPKARTAIMADAERYIQERVAHADRAVKDGWAGIQADLTRQIEASERLPGVDKQALQAPGTNWQQMAEQIHAAGATWKEGQLTETVTKAEERATKAEAAAALSAKENEDLRAEMARRTPGAAVVGRTAGAAQGTPLYDPSKGWQGNLLDAFAPTNGTG